MTPLQMAAQFAAYLWFINQPEHTDLPRAAAHRFARLNWERFLPNADEGFGRLLLAVADYDEDAATIPEIDRRPQFREALAIA